MKLSQTFVIIGLALSCMGSASAQVLPGKKIHDFMVDNSPLKAAELETAFRGQTHRGFYRFDRDAQPTHRFEETTSKEGRVKHVQGDEVITGAWAIKGDQICFIYEEIWGRPLCFDIYQKGNCYYHYLMTEGGRPVQSWTARSSLKGERPNCEPNIS